MRSSLLWKQSKQNEKDKRHDPNKVRERWNNKEEVNKGVGASSLEIRTGIFSKSVTLWLLAILQRLPRVT